MQSAVFIPLIRVSSVIDLGDHGAGHSRINGTSGYLLCDPSRSIGHRGLDFNRSYESFDFAVRVLMYGYVLSSCEEERGDMWRPMQSAAKHIAKPHSRAGARIQQWIHPRVADAEMTVRREWQLIGAEGPSLSLAVLIELVSRRYSIWQLVLDLQTQAPANTRNRGQCVMFPVVWCLLGPSEVERGARALR